MRCLLLFLCSSCSLYLPELETPRHFRCERPTDCVDGQYCVQGYCQSGLLAAGRLHTCALDGEGEATCWGAGTNDSNHPHLGQADPPAGPFVDLTAGILHTCALHKRGKPVCWGDNTLGQSEPPEGVRFVDISAGDFHTCGVTGDDEVLCWGSDLDGQSSPPRWTENRLTQVYAGGSHTCAVTASQTVACWGSNDYDQATPPTVALLEGRTAQLCVGRSHNCAIFGSGDVGCWGAGTPISDEGDYPHYGQATPETSFDYLQLACGAFHTCGIDEDNEVHCWGLSANARLFAPDKPFRFISAGWAHNCGIRDENDHINCWGAGTVAANCDGELGINCGQSVVPKGIEF